MSLFDKAFSAFGMQLRVASDQAEWDRLLLKAKAAGGVDVGETTRNDYAIVIDERHGMIVCKDNDTLKRLVAAIPVGKP